MSKTSPIQIRLPAEWEPQDAVLLVWPHRHTDWAPYLSEVQALYRELIATIARFEQVLIAAPDPTTVYAVLDGIENLERVRVFAVATQDTWARDFGPITVHMNDRLLLLDFRFNGWGQKYASHVDNRITQTLHARGAFGKTEREAANLVLEGGSIESDGQGTLLTTRTCLLNPNRNPHLNKERLDAALRYYLGVERILWLSEGHLVGDDTDAHIDTLVRFAPNDTLVYAQCPIADDEHYAGLQAMEKELKTFRTRVGKSYQLVPLPWPDLKLDAQRQRLPATYANFLIINGAVLVPTYQDPQDEAALKVIRQAFPNREVLGIDCSVLIRQHGSLHCITMQLPQGVLS